jgi:ABC-type Na+ transport system ATPase subunit NatA
MNEISDKRVDIEMRTSIDRYVEHIKKIFKESIYSSGSWDDKKVNEFCQAVRISHRGELITIVATKNKVHSYVATKDIDHLKRGSIFGKTWFGNPALGSPIGNVLNMP